MMRRPRSRPLLLLALLSALSIGAEGAAADSLESFLERIQSADDGTRLAARLEAPQWGAAAVPALAKLMAGENREAGITARHALERIVHETARPGSKIERAPVLAAVAALTDAANPPYVRREAIYWLGLIGGDDEARVVARYLGDQGEKIAEAARLALEDMPSRAALEALHEAVRGFSGTFQSDLVFSIGKKQQPESVPLLLSILSEAGGAGSPEAAAELRFAACQALARSGSLEAVAPLREACQAAQDPMRGRLYGELLRLADELFERGEWVAAREIFADVLASGPFDYHRERALLRLARPGDLNATSVLLAGLRDSSARVRRTSLSLLGSLRGVTVFDSLRRGYEEAEDAVRPAILRALVEIDGSGSRDLLARAQESTDADLKITALDLSGAAADSMAEICEAKAADAESPVRAAAWRGLTRLAKSKLEKGDGAAALAGYRRSLALAREVDERQEALAGLLAVGAPDVLDDLASLRKDTALSREAALGTIALAKKLAAAGDIDRAVPSLEEIVGGDFPGDLVLEAASVLRASGRDPQRRAREQGFVVDWWLIGPFADNGSGMETALFPEERQDFDALERIGPRRFRWKRPGRLTLDGRVNLVVEFRRSQNVLAYACADLESSEERDVLIKLGSDDGAACWLNGERLVHSPGSRQYEADKDVVPARLARGKNRILVKVAQKDGDWLFSLRITDRDGKPLALPSL